MGFCGGWTGELNNACWKSPHLYLLDFKAGSNFSHYHVRGWGGQSPYSRRWQVQRRDKGEWPGSTSLSLPPLPHLLSPCCGWGRAGVFALALLLARRTLSPRLKDFIKRYVIHLELAFPLRDTNAPAPKSSWRNLSSTGAEDPQVLFHIKKNGFSYLKDPFKVSNRFLVS